MTHTLTGNFYLGPAIGPGKLYGGTATSAKLCEWNGTNAWTEVAPRLGTETRIWSLAVF